LTSLRFDNVEEVGDEALGLCPALTSVYFGQNAPSEGSDVYLNTPNVTNYVTSSTATGWGATWNGRPVVRLPVTSDMFIGSGAGVSNVNAVTVGGLTAEDLMRVGNQYFFTTNLISYGSVTGRSTSIIAPTTTQMASYTGPTNGQYLGTYLIPSNEMPTVLLRGVYTFKFFGYHTGNQKHPMVGADVYIVTASNGVVVQEFKNQIGAEVPYSAASTPQEFLIQVNVTNDFQRDGYAFVLKTKMIDPDGYNGTFYSYFGVGYWAGFIVPIATGLYVTKAEAGSAAYQPTSAFDPAGTAAGVSNALEPRIVTLEGRTNVWNSAVTNGQTNVVLGLASGTTVATATAGSEPATLDQVLSLLESSSTLYLSPSNCTVCPQNTVTNRTLSATPSAAAWTIVYSGTVTNGQYLFSFVAPSNEVATVLAGNQTANIYMTYTDSGGPGATLTCKMEGYVYDPATSNSTDYAETATSFSVAKSATLPATPTTPIAVIPYATNLTGNLRYQIRIKAITANNVSSVTMWGGGNSISSVSFPVSDSVTLGARGATGIKDSLGNAGTYDSTVRTLTMPALTPTGIAAGGGVTTNSIPGPGCTYLGTSQAVTLTGATTSYRSEPAGVYTVSVAQAASRYTYALEVVSTNPCTLAAGLNLQGSWTITGTNILAIVPCTGTLWRVYGRGI
jgi:hypothetical protein